jgi:hypothetical protein
MAAIAHRPLTVEEEEALLALGSRGPSASVDPSAMRGLVDAEMVEVDKYRRVVLTALGKQAYASLESRLLVDGQPL